jgi:hypothetical protein
MVIETMHCGPELEDTTFEWPREGMVEQYVGTRTDQDRHFTILRIDDRWEVDEYEDPETALLAALAAAEELVRFVVDKEDDPDAQLIEAFLMSEIAQVRWGVWRNIAAQRARESWYRNGVYATDTSAKALGKRLGLPAVLVEETLA